MAGNATIGFGHLIRSGEEFGSITRDEGLLLLQQDLEQFLPYLDAIEVELCQAQVDALASFIYNVGAGAFQGSTLRRRLNAGEYDAVPSELNRWVYAGGRTWPGLVTRRAEEGRLFQTGEYGAGN